MDGRKIIKWAAAVALLAVAIHVALANATAVNATQTNATQIGANVTQQIGANVTQVGNEHYESEHYEDNGGKAVYHEDDFGAETD